MTTQRLYDLLLEAEWRGSDSELDHCAFLLESFPNIGWLRAIIKEDTNRLAGLMDGQQTAVSHKQAVLRCIEYASKEGYAGALAALIASGSGRMLAESNARIQRKTKKAGHPEEPPENTSIEQKLYERIVAVDLLDTDFHVSRVAEMLGKFRCDVLDTALLVQDAPRIARSIKQRAPSPELLKLYGDATNPGLFRFELAKLSIYIELYRGLVQEVAQLIKDLFASYGATSFTTEASMRQLIAEGKIPRKLTVERKTQQRLTALYVWMIEDRSGSGAYGSLELKNPLVDCAKVWDAELVEKTLQPLVEEHKGERLLKFVVCVANSRLHATQLAEQHAREWQLYSKGHLSEQLDARDARYVILLSGSERPRSVFVWGKQNYYSQPEPSAHSLYF